MISLTFLGMFDWWQHITDFEKIFWYIAIPFTVIFLIQLILTFAGMGDHSGDTDFDHHDGGDVHDQDSDSDNSFQVFTVRNFIIFVTIFAWSGIVFSKYELNRVLILVLSTIDGLVMVFIMSWLFYTLHKLAESGTMNVNNALNKIAEVYIPIPPQRKGYGKVQLNIQGAIRELEAITDENQIATGTLVKITEIIDDHILVVETISKESGLAT